jgi:hypothetical protein
MWSVLLKGKGVLRVNENRSEVARMRRRIDLEYEAARQGLHGLAAGSARHDFITARMERFAQKVFDLRTAGRVEEADALMLSDQAWETMLNGGEEVANGA